MPVADKVKNEIVFKIVYWGPGLAGKRTNVESLYDVIHPPTEPYPRRNLTSHYTDRWHFVSYKLSYPKRTAFHSFNARVECWAQAGSLYHPSAWRRILKGVDGIVFVADSQIERLDADIHSLEMLKGCLKLNGDDFERMPYVLQLNKRDIPGVMSVAELEGILRCKGEPTVEAVAFKGIGVWSAFDAVAKQIFSKFENDTCLEEGGISQSPSFEFLIETLKTSEKPFMRWSAASALEDLGDVRAVQPLSEALRDQDDNVRSEAAYALDALAGEKAAELLAPLLIDKNEFVRCIVEKILSGRKI